MNIKELSTAGLPVALAPDADKLKAMLQAADGANHVGEYPTGKFYPMPNSVGTIHNVADLQLILQLWTDVESLQVENSKLYNRWDAAEQLIVTERRLSR